MSLEWRARLAYRVHALGVGVGRPISAAAAAEIAERVETRADPWPHLWDAVMRRELRLDPSIRSMRDQAIDAHHTT